MIQYSAKLTDKQCQVIEKIINTQERKLKHFLRNIMNAILYLLKTGCQWCMIPKDFAPCESVYYFSNKKIKGRKQHIIVDTQGNLMAIAVHEANVHDSEGAPEVIKNLAYKFPRLAKTLADSGYRGNLADWILDKFGWELEVVLRPDECPSKFKVLPKRWIVERFFAWLENFRRLTIDYEYNADTAVAMVQLAFCKIMLNKYIG